jgi:hypothetical protein
MGSGRTPGHASMHYRSLVSSPRFSADAGLSQPVEPVQWVGGPAQ